MTFFTDGSDLRAKREEACLSLAELAELSGVSKGSIGNFETGVRGLGRKSQRAIYEALKKERLQTSSDGAVRESCGLCEPPSLDELKARISKLEAQLDRANETIASQARTIEAMQQGRSTGHSAGPAAPTARAGGLRHHASTSEDRRAGA